LPDLLLLHELLCSTPQFILLHELACLTPQFELPELLSLQPFPALVDEGISVGTGITSSMAGTGQGLGFLTQGCGIAGHCFGLFVVSVISRGGAILIYDTNR
jgi:hypothetical protein